MVGPLERSGAADPRRGQLQIETQVGAAGGRPVTLGAIMFVPSKFDCKQAPSIQE